jgi:hypothetical protein
MIKRMTHVTMKFWREETISDKRRVNSYLSWVLWNGYITFNNLRFISNCKWVF